MQIGAIALVCLLTAGGAAWAADAARAPDETPGTFALPDPDTPATPAARVKPPVTPGVAAAPHPRPDTAHRVDPPHARVCFNASDTRDKIATHRLTDPVRALRAGRLQGEALRARLCRWRNDEFVYEISVLRRDGRIVRVYMNAENGQSVGALSDGGDHK